MKTGVIDIGSNSVRLMMWEDGKTLYKSINTTRLGEGTQMQKHLLPEAIERTVKAVAEFEKKAKGEGAEKVYAFATEAVRSSDNRDDFLSAIQDACGIFVDVLSGKDEATFGAMGALEGQDGIVIDIGGASSEVTIVDNGVVRYAESFPIGCVRLFDACGRNFEKCIQHCEDFVSKISLPTWDVRPCTSIGGTATSLAAVKLGLMPYDPLKVDGSYLPVEWLYDFAKDALSKSVDEVKGMPGMDPKRADVIGGGAILLYTVAKKMNATKIKVSEKDNLEGYIINKNK